MRFADPTLPSTSIEQSCMACDALHWWRRCRFDLHAEAVGDAIHESEVRDDGTRVVNGAIVKPGLPEADDVLLIDGRRRSRQLVTIFEQRRVRLGEETRFQGLGRQRREEIHLFVDRHACGSQDAAEPRRVMMKSIMAAVQRRHTDAEHLPPAPVERARTMHQGEIQIVVVAHDRRVDPVDLDDIVGIGHTLVGPQRGGICVSDERHGGHHTAAPIMSRIRRLRSALVRDGAFSCDRRPMEETDG